MSDSTIKTSLEQSKERLAKAFAELEQAIQDRDNLNKSLNIENDNLKNQHQIILSKLQNSEHNNQTIKNISNEVMQEIDNSIASITDHLSNKNGSS